MAQQEPVSTLDTNQVATTDLANGVVPAPGPGAQAGQAPASDVNLYPPGGPQPEGTEAGEAREMAQKAQAQGENAPGILAEEVVWEARYSLKNFIGRLAFRAILTVAWIALAVYTWGMGHTNVTPGTILLGVVLGYLWLSIIYRIIRAYYGHKYQLTNRRLFVSTGLLRRRRDQMELLRIKDVYTRSTWLDRCFSIGTVVVVSDERSLPIFYLAGVHDPHAVMDLVWHHARAEREGTSVQVDNV